MLDASLAIELKGSSIEYLRKYAKACIDLAHELTHKRTANVKNAAL